MTKNKLKQITFIDKLINLFTENKVKGYCHKCSGPVFNLSSVWAKKGICVYCFNLEKIWIPGHYITKKEKGEKTRVWVSGYYKYR